MMQRFLSVIAVLMAMTPCYAQDAIWVDQMKNPNVNFYTVQQNFEQYWAEKNVEKGKGWKQFKRWEAFTEPRVYPDGERPSPHIISEAYNWVFSHSAKADLGQWKPLGPYNGSSLGGIGRVNRLTFDPQDNNIIWAATPAGGLWKSTDAGQTWTTNTDKLVNLGSSDVVIHPTNSNIMYLATGDRDAGDTYSFGVLKSTDGGNTWTPTGLTNQVTQQARINDLYIHPNYPDTLLAATTGGIFRTTDAGATWTSVKTGGHNEIIQKPNDPDVLYVSSRSGTSNRIFKSTNNGISWVSLSSPILPSTSRRIELATTPDAPNYIYALYGNTSNGFGGLYRSTDEGATWTAQSTSPNLLGWRTDGNDAGGQAWYDLALAVNPSDKDEIFVGGVNIWTSKNGGTSWNLAAHWYGGGGAPYVHADIHDLEYRPGTDELYAGTDGGVYRDMPNQRNWDALNNGLNITQYYKFSNAATDTTHIVAGAQDNGTHYRRSSGWADIYGGDGMDCAIDSKDPNTVYVSVYYGDFSKSTNGGFSFNAPFNLPPAGNGNWVTPFLMDPKHPDTLYAGFSSIWRSVNGGASFSSLGGGTGSGNVDVLAIAPEHTNIIFAGNGHRSYKSTNHGTSWTQMTTGGGRSVSGIAAAHDNPDYIVVTKSGYTATDKVYQSTDGGSTFTNISAGLPNVPVNCVVIEDNNVHSTYIGTDIGVFYKDDNNPTWTSFNYNLPNVIVTELEINYNNRKLRAATYGRGVWQSPLYTDLVPPTAQANLPANVCVGDTVTLTHSSQYSPDQFQWYIAPATYTFVNNTTATSENPQVVFSQTGFYDLSLSVQNVLGGDSAFYPAGIAVGGLPISYSTGFETTPETSKWSFDENSPGWSLAQTSNGTSFKADLFAQNTGLRHELISPAYDFSGHDSVWLSFDYAYSGTPTNAGDSLLIYAASGCSDNWTLIQAMGDDGTGNFTTTGGQSAAFVPTTGDWCGSNPACPDVNLAAYAGQVGVRLKFVAVSQGGNDLYLDNVQISGNPTSVPAVDFSSVRTACALDTVTFNDLTNGSATQWQWTISGPVTINASVQNPEIAFTQAGTYTVKLKAFNSIGSDSLTKTSYLTVTPADSVSIQLDYAGAFYCTTDTLQLTATVSNTGSNPSYVWYLNQNEYGRSTTPNFSFSGLQPGDKIYARVTSSATCAFPDVMYSDTAKINVHPPVSLTISPISNVCVSASSVTLNATPAGGSFSGPGVAGNIFDPSMAGVGTHKITYTYQDANGCINVEKTTVVVEQPVTITIDPSFTVCETFGIQSLSSAASPRGGTYSGAGVYGNNFYPDSVGVGVHPVTYTVNSGVCGSVSKVFNVTVHKVDTPTVIVHNGYLECSLTAPFYQWYNGFGIAVQGANSKTFTPTSNDRYRVDILDANGCLSRSEFTDFSIGLEELPAGFDFSLFPNPANDVVNLSVAYNETIQLELIITNLTGQTVMQQDLQFDAVSSQSVDLSALPQGVYLFHLKGSTLSISKKVVVKH